MKKSIRMLYVWVSMGYTLIAVFSSCGTLGGFPNESFPVSKKSLEKGIDSLFLNHNEYRIPQKWLKLDNWSQRGFDFLDSRIFYFHSSPEEMYYVTILGDTTTKAESSTTSISIRAINIGYRWFKYNEISDKEKKRIIDRFDREIITKLEVYTGSEVKKEKE